MSAVKDISDSSNISPQIHPKLQSLDDIFKSKNRLGRLDSSRCIIPHGRKEKKFLQNFIARLLGETKSFYVDKDGLGIHETLFQKEKAKWTGTQSEIAERLRIVALHTAQKAIFKLGSSITLSYQVEIEKVEVPNEIIIGYDDDGNPKVKVDPNQPVKIIEEPVFLDYTKSNVRGGVTVINFDPNTNELYSPLAVIVNPNGEKENPPLLEDKDDNPSCSKQ